MAFETEPLHHLVAWLDFFKGQFNDCGLDLFKTECSDGLWIISRSIPGGSIAIIMDLTERRVTCELQDHKDAERQYPHFEASFTIVNQTDGGSAIVRRQYADAPDDSWLAPLMQKLGLARYDEQTFPAGQGEAFTDALGEVSMFVRDQLKLGVLRAET